jgi:hypothetical protein
VLPDDVRALRHPAPYRVRYSDSLIARQRALEAATRATETVASH